MNALNKPIYQRAVRADRPVPRQHRARYVCKYTPMNLMGVVDRLTDIDGTISSLNKMRHKGRSFHHSLSISSVAFSDWSDKSHMHFQAVVYLHENKVMHRNIRCSNILITKDGEIKLSDFGISCQLKSTMDRSKTIIGSPSWMAPEVVVCGEGYENRADVWALGITAIEMVDAKAPFQDMHPTRALFQIVRNPPPSVSKPAMSSNEINDFIAE